MRHAHASGPRGDTGSREDESPDGRVATAEALANPGRDEEALALLRSAPKHDRALVRLAALSAPDRMGSRARAALTEIRAAGMSEKSHAADCVNRMVEYLPGMTDR